MKIEAGKLYRTRDGRKAFVSRDDDHAFKVAMVGFGYCKTFGKDGRYDVRYNGRDSHLDIVAEWEDPQDVQTDTNTPQPKTHKISDMWVVWEHQYNNDGKLTCHRKFCYFPNEEEAKKCVFEEAKKGALHLRKLNQESYRYSVTRADATEFTEGEGL